MRELLFVGCYKYRTEQFLAYVLQEIGWEHHIKVFNFRLEINRRYLEYVGGGYACILGDIQEIGLEKGILFIGIFGVLIGKDGDSRFEVGLCVDDSVRIELRVEIVTTSWYRGVIEISENGELLLAFDSP